MGSWRGQWWWCCWRPLGHWLHWMICTCMCTCTCMCVFEFIYVCFYACMCVLECVCMCTCDLACINGHMYVYLYVYVCIYVCISVFEHVYKCARTHTGWLLFTLSYVGRRGASNMAIVEVKMLSGFNPAEGTRQQVRSVSSPHLISSIAWQCGQYIPHGCVLKGRHRLVGLDHGTLLGILCFCFPPWDGVLDCSREDSRAYFREDLGHRVALVFELLPGTFPL